jgi:hypothetical protein
VKADAASAFVDWIISEAGQSAIASYKVDGQQLFFPNAAKHGPVLTGVCALQIEVHAELAGYIVAGHFSCAGGKRI